MRSHSVLYVLLLVLPGPPVRGEVQPATPTQDSATHQLWAVLRSSSGATYVQTLVLVITAIFTAWFLLRQLRAMEHQRRSEVTDRIFGEWWSERLRLLRRAFYTDCLDRLRSPEYLDRLRSPSGVRMKDFIEEFQQEGLALTQLCYFFDRIGWLGAAGLIEVDYILGPMQHLMRRLWVAVEPMILKEREQTQDKTFDPVYQFGFEWLFKRSQVRHQAQLIQMRFQNPRVLNANDALILRKNIDSEEQDFLRELKRNTSTIADNRG